MYICIFSIANQICIKSDTWFVGKSFENSLGEHFWLTCSEAKGRWHVHGTAPVDRGRRTVNCQGCGASWRLKRFLFHLMKVHLWSSKVTWSTVPPRCDCRHLSALLDPLLQEISKPGEANRDTTVDEEELVTSKGGPQPASSLRPALRHFLRGNARAGNSWLEGATTSLLTTLPSPPLSCQSEQVTKYRQVAEGTWCWALSCRLAAKNSQTIVVFVSEVQFPQYVTLGLPALSCLCRCFYNSLFAQIDLGQLCTVALNDSMGVNLKHIIVT